MFQVMRQIFCFLCSSLIIEKNSLFCRFCKSKLNPFIKKPKSRMQGSVRHHYLFSWNSQNDLLCRSIVYFLKEKPETFFSYFSKNYKYLKLLNKTAFICPHSNRRINHAKSLAESFSKLFESSSVYEVESVTDDSSPQKTLKKRERMERLKRKIYPSQPISEWVFVDDVLVTGSTYYTLYESIGRKPQAIFTLFYKELACEDHNAEE